MSAAARTRPELSDRDIYVPQLNLQVDGRELHADTLAAVTSFEYRDRLGAVGCVELALDNWDPHARRFTVSESDDFVPGRRLRASLGHRGGEVAALFDGRIAYMQTVFPQQGAPTVVVGAVDLLHDLRGEQRSVVYQDKTDCEVAQEIADRIGAAIETRCGGEEPRHAFLFQRNQYDVVFLLERARARGYELTVDYAPGSDTPRLGFGPGPGGDRPEYELHYGRTLSSFRAFLDVSRQVHEVVVRSWDPLAKELLTATSSSASVTTALGGPGTSTIDAAYGKRKEVVADTPIASQEEASALAQAVLDDVVRQQVVGAGETFGLPRLRAGRRLVLAGLGDRYSGEWYVTSSVHVVGADGYRTRFECRREEVA